MSTTCGWSRWRQPWSRTPRFDPLLSLEFEQRLFASLPQVAARAATEGRAEAVLEDGGTRFAVDVDAQTLAAAAQPFYRELARLARSARIAGQSAALVLPADRAAGPDSSPVCSSTNRTAW